MTLSEDDAYILLCRRCKLPIKESEPSTEIDSEQYHDRCAVDYLRDKYPLLSSK